MISDDELIRDKEEISRNIKIAEQESLSDPSTGYRRAAQAAASARALNDLILEGEAIAYQALCALHLTKNEEALQLALHAQQIVLKYKPEMLPRVYLLLGMVYRNFGNYDVSLEYFFSAVKSPELEKDVEATLICYYNIGGIYAEMKEPESSITYFEKALAFSKENNSKLLGRILNGIGNCYFLQKKYDEASQLYALCLETFLAEENQPGIARTYTDMAVLAFAEGKSSQALAYHKLALSIRRTLSFPMGIVTNLLHLSEIYLYNANLEAAKEALIEAEYLAQQSNSKPQQQEVSRLFSEYYEQKGDLERSLQYLRANIAISKEIFNEETATRLSRLKTSLAIEESEKLAAAERNKAMELQTLYEEIKRQNTLLEEQSRAIAEKNTLLEEQQRLLEIEKLKSDTLLLNILPVRIAEKLKSGSETIAERMDNVGVLFADIVGFTKLSAAKEPEEVVALLDEIFSEFDHLATAFAIEKIKTIGDAYMAVAGNIEQPRNAACRVIDMAIEMQNAMKSLRSKKKVDIQLRIGLNVGPVVAGVIGRQKYAYDLWGDTVNIASRMESLGSPGKIHCTEIVRSFADDAFVFEERGLIQVKGKGSIPTFYISERKVQRSEVVRR